jgi:soluble lytic murein transglycosylase
VFPARVTAVVLAALLGAGAAVVRAQDADAGSGDGGAPREPLAGLRSLVAAHRDPEALASLEALGADVRAEPRVLYLRARLLERLGRPSEAADALADTAALPDFARRDAARRRAVLLARAGRCAEAAPLLEALPGDVVSVLAQRAACAQAAGDLPLALVAERAAVRAAGESAFGERLQLAALLVAAGLRAEAARELRALALARPEHAKDAVVLARLAELEGTGSAARFSLEERLARAERLSHERQHERALAELDAARPPSGRGAAARAVRARYLHLRGMALYGTRGRYPEAARVLADAARQGGGTATEDAFTSARALSRADEDAAAIRAYTVLVRAHPDAPEAAEAEYLAALLSLRTHARDGVARLERFLRGPRAARSPDFARSARAELAFAKLDAGRFLEAREAFAAYADSGTGGLVRGRGAYWAGRAAEGAHQRAAAIAHYREAIAAEALHWYALCARARLEALGEEVGPPLPPAPAGGAAAPPALVVALPEATTFYDALGLREDALAALRRDEDAVRRAAPSGRELEALAGAYLALGDAARAYHLVASRATLTHAPDPADAWLWAAAYPRPYEDAVRAATSEQALPEDYLYAIMRQESGYDPNAVSYADAIGLLQLLPSTARRLAEAIGLRPFDRALLFEPETNVRLSAAYHASLLRAFGDQWPLAIAAYNAGGPRVRRWLRAIPDEELPRFVERIPVDQTRNYVRRVLTHLARYRYLRDPARGWPFALPATLDRARVTDER